MKKNDGVSQTIRQQIIAGLSKNDMDAREISQLIRIREKDVYDHLSHISRSVLTRHKRLVILPLSCLDCGYIFKDRKRFTPPGRCPRCKSTHVEIPRYRIS